MNKDKWLKWQIGAVGALAIGLLFQQVKGSAAFAKAQEQTLAAKSNTNSGSTPEEGFGGRANDGGQSSGYNAPSQGKRSVERSGGQRSRMQADAGSQNGGQSGSTNGSQNGGQNGSANGSQGGSGAINGGQSGSRSQNGSGSQGQVQAPQTGLQPDASAGSSRRQTRTGRS